MPPPLIHLKETTLTFGGSPLLTGAELTVFERERLCLVGRNGSGKSTFLKIVAGEITADGGERFVQPGTTIRYLPQEPDLSAFATIRDYAMAGLNESDDPYRVDYLLDALKIDGDREPVNLSGGESRRAALCRALAPEPDVLLLDEPTNHLDLPAIEWLEEELKSTKSALVLISHDRAFLSALSKGTVWLDRGVTHKIPQGFDGFEEWRDKFFEEEDRNLQKLKQKIVAEEDWLRYGVTARRKRNVRRLGDLHSLRAEHAEKRRSNQRDDISMEATSADASGKLVVEAHGLSKSFGDKKIVDDFSIRIARGERIGVVGPNGAGKTTLLKLILGELTPDTGTIKLGSNLETATLDQQRSSLSPDWSLKDSLTQGTGDTVTVGGATKHVMSYMKDFLFRPEQANTPIHALSGGERGRVMLARALSQPSNLMVLDEPTNDLDLETLDLLQELLSNFEGTVIIVSHDRDFIDRVATSTIAYEQNGKWLSYPGGYSDMVSQRGYGVKDADAGIAKKVARSKLEDKAQQPSKASKAKLSYKEEHALKTLPDEIAKLERDMEKLNTALSDPDLYSRDPATFEKYSKALEGRQALLDKAETRWLELEELKQSLS
ncbi:MAG: ATP-binding cassette domain-containing protein [Hyphomicrobiales bacterium]